MHIGRVVGHRVTETRFRTDYKEPLQVGELLIVEEEGSDSRFLIRVMDIQYGADSESENWMEKKAGGLLADDRDEGRSDISTLTDRLYRVGVSTPLGYLDGRQFKKTKTIPFHFSKVRKADGDDYQFLKDFMGDIEVGLLRSGDEVLQFPVGISSRSIPHHIGIFATTGMGKSNLMKNLALSCMKQRKFGFLILDPHGEYYDGGEKGKRGLIHSSQQGALEVFSSRELKGPYNTLNISASEIEITDLENLYEFSQPQIECLQSSHYKYGKSWLVDLYQKGVEQINRDLGERFHEGTINVIKRRLENIFRFGLLTTDSKLSITSHVLDCLHSGKVVLVDTSNMLETEELLVSTVLSRAVFEKNKALYSEKSKDVPPVLVAMEEAQRVLSQARGTIFYQIAREGRKFRVGLCAVSQQPKLIDNQIISQFNTLFVLGLSDRRDREILMDSAKQDVSRLDNEIQMLMPGEALVASPFTPFAIPLKVHLYEDRLENDTNEEDKTNRGVIDLKFF